MFILFSIVGVLIGIGFLFKYWLRGNWLASFLMIIPATLVTVVILATISAGSNAAPTTTSGALTAMWIVSIAIGLGISYWPMIHRINKVQKVKEAIQSEWEREAFANELAWRDELAKTGATMMDRQDYKEARPEPVVVKRDPMATVYDPRWDAFCKRQDAAIFSATRIGTMLPKLAILALALASLGLSACGQPTFADREQAVDQFCKSNGRSVAGVSGCFAYYDKEQDVMPPNMTTQYEAPRPAFNYGLAAMIMMQTNQTNADRLANVGAQTHYNMRSAAGFDCYNTGAGYAHCQ